MQNHAKAKPGQESNQGFGRAAGRVYAGLERDKRGIKMAYRRNENFKSIREIWEEEELEGQRSFCVEDKMDDFRNK